jgi:DNA-directed RNA polymerase subunit omega
MVMAGRATHLKDQGAALVTVASSAIGEADRPVPTAADITAAGITYPPIDELLGKASSKYALAIFAAKRARQINDYYSRLSEGLLEYVGPLLDPMPKEKPLSIALREINAGLLEHVEGE